MYDKDLGKAFDQYHAVKQKHVCSFFHLSVGGAIPLCLSLPALAGTKGCVTQALSK